MRSSKKVWVIDVDDIRDRVRGHDSQGSSEEGRERLRLHVGPEPNRTGRLFLGAYLLGPLAPVVMRQGRGSVLWAVLGLLALPLWGMTLWRWSEVSYRLESGQIPFSLWFVTLGVVSLLGGLAWARALWLAGGDSRFFADRVPRWLSSPLPAGLLGLCVPGSGLLLVGAPRRAALALLGFLTMLVSMVVLWKSQWLWQLNRMPFAANMDPRSLERVFLASAALGFTGGMIWVASVLDGMRCGLRSRGGPATGLGDWMTFLLLIALIATYAGSEPTSAARDVHNYATSLQHEGMQIVPLQLARLAKRLDPARPRYALHLASLLDENGDVADAEILRGQTLAYWQEYERLRKSETPVLGESLLAVPAPLDSASTFVDSLAALSPSDSLPLRAVPADSVPAKPADTTAAPTSAP